MSTSLYQRIRIALFRWLVRTVIQWKWLGKRETRLTVNNETMPVGNARIGLRIYTPEGRGPFPVLLFFHGGGWVIGDLETHDPLCRDLCTHSRHVVVAVGYRLAPEFRFPIPVKDCLASVRWVIDSIARYGGDADRMTLCGDSAGGNLAAVVAQQSRHLYPARIKGQILIYPVTDDCRVANWGSYKTYGAGRYALPLSGMKEFWDLYTTGSDQWSPAAPHDLAAPLHTKDVSDLPPTLVILAAQDLLCDEGLAYAKRLADAGTDVELKMHEGQQHAFVASAPTTAHRAAVAQICAWLLQQQHPESR